MNAPMSPRAITYALLALLAVYVAVAAGARAVQRPFWFDEIFTIAVTNSGSPGQIWTALHDAVDGQPPLFYLVQRAVHGAVGCRLRPLAASRDSATPRILYLVESPAADAKPVGTAITG
jgi:hypothetical protein